MAIIATTALVVGTLSLRATDTWPPPSSGPETIQTFSGSEGAWHWQIEIDNALDANSPVQRIDFATSGNFPFAGSSVGGFYTGSDDPEENGSVISLPIPDGKTLVVGPAPTASDEVRFNYEFNPISKKARCSLSHRPGFERRTVTAPMKMLPVGTETGKWFEVLLPKIDPCDFNFQFVNSSGNIVQPTRF